MNEIMNHYSCVKDIIAEYKSTFAQDWIKKLDWKQNENSSYSEGKRKIDDFADIVFVVFSKSILAGDYAAGSIDVLMDELKDFVELCTDELLPATENKLYSKLQTDFINLNHNIVDFINYYRLMINELREKLQVSDNVFIINAISNKSEDYSNKLFEALDVILEICFNEFSYSYKEKNIRDLIIKRDKLNRIKSSQSKIEIKNIIEIVCEKIEYLLVKFSSISSTKNLRYSLDFVPQTIKLLEDKESRFTSYKRYGYFLDPHDIPKSVIREWQNDCYNGNAKMWEMALLMRYYTKVEKNEKQIENLINQFEEFVERQKKDDTRLFDAYALNTIINYMYNCRFSFLTSNLEIPVERLVSEIERIENIHSLTGIKNYHPFQKAIEFLKVFIRKEISSKKNVGLIIEHKRLYNKTLKELQESYQWCKTNQFYPFQLCFDECLDRLNDIEMVVFTPSSFCRPINYLELDDIVKGFKSDSMTLDSEILLYKEELEILEVKNSIEKNKKTYIEILGVFTGLVTFLIGCITIFTNVEDAGVPLKEKIEHVSLLGIIVLLLINGGYFLTSEIKCKSIKFWFIMVTSLLYLAVLIKAYLV